MSRVILDTGAFIAFERGDGRMRARIVAAQREKVILTTTSPVVAQVWRDGRRQALLAVLLRATKIDPPSERAAKRAGELLAKTKTNDVVDALLVTLARDGDVIATSDPRDIEILVAAAKTNATVVAV